MTTLPPSLVTKLCFYNCIAVEPSKLAFATHCVCGNKATGKPVQKKLLPRDVSQNVIKTPRWSLNLMESATSRLFVQGTEQMITACNEVGVSSYLFRTENGSLVKVSVIKKNVKYAVHIEVSSLGPDTSDSKLLLTWGIYRSDSSCPMPFDSQHSSIDVRTIETPLTRNSFGQLALDLEFEAKQTPFYLSFLLKSVLNAESTVIEIRSHRRENFCVPIGFDRGDVWHASLEGAWNFLSYGYQCKGSAEGNNENFDANLIVWDPYAKVAVTVSVDNGSGLLPRYLGRLCKEPVFDWNGDVRPNLAMEKLVVYRLNVRHFTEHKSSQLSKDIAGTFVGLTEKLNHLKNLGVNAVLLEPIFPFDEKKGPYFPCHFFSPTNLYGPSGGSVSAISSMKEMVKNMHSNGIEVLLEVVFTHTADHGALQGIDDPSYYYVNRDVDLQLSSALNCNYPVVQGMILDSLRYWVTEFYVDGFCFINASSLLIGFHGERLSRPPLVEAIAFDPLLSKIKIIADCWDPQDMVPKETCFPHWKRWAELNTKFCYDVRNFLRGEGLLSNLATRLCGSGDIFLRGRGPSFSFNFIARNFGLPLVDVVSFSSGGLALESSWNCGEEGPTNKTPVLERRLKQIRNHLFILYVSLGVPVLNMGDECGQSSGGSILYVDRKPFDWNALSTSFGNQTTRFISFLSSLRVRRSDLLQRGNFLKEENVQWNGSDQSPPRWEDPTCKFLAMTLKADEETQSSYGLSHPKGDLYIAFNAAGQSESVVLPPTPEGMVWRRLVDTALPFPAFFSNDGELVVEQMAGLITYEMKSHSCTLFEASSHDS
uniref:Glycosyl hydrolase family 13 catalytic domain-containing protein n=1 Tax=Rhizophora mucronata TaxID=61149 RepID=A0A2P2K3R8_RHIMU